MINFFYLFFFLVQIFYGIKNSYTFDQRIFYYSLKMIDKDYLNNKDDMTLKSLNSLGNDLALYWKNRYYELFNEINQIKGIPLAQNLNYKKPSEYNFVVLLKDLVPMTKDYPSYAKIYINHQFIGETKHGLRSEFKDIKLNLKANEKFLLNIEKYTFNEFKKIWEREFNLYQPKKKYLTIPNDRILIYEIIYDAEKETPETGHLKYTYNDYFLTE